MFTILFPTDFSEIANNAWRYAFRLAHLLNANIEILHTYTYEPHDLEALSATLRGSLSLDKEAEAAWALSCMAKETWKALEGNVSVGYQLQQGFPAEEISRYAQQVGANLIVMGTHGQGGLMSRLMGSVAAEVMQRGPCPVLAVPPTAVLENIRDITFTGSFKEDDDEAFEVLEAFGKRLNSRLSCVHIWDGGQTPNKQEHALDWHFKQKAEALEIQYFPMRFDNAKEGLLHFFKGHKTDILTMCTHARSTLDSFFHPSLTIRLLQELNLPILGFRAENLWQLSTSTTSPTN